MLFLSWDLEYTGLVTNFGPVPFVPWGTSRRVGRSKNIHNEKASTFHETLEVGVKDAVIQINGPFCNLVMAASDTNDENSFTDQHVRTTEIYASIMYSYHNSTKVTETRTFATDKYDESEEE